MMEPENTEESLQRREGVVSNRRKRYERMVEIRLLEDKVIEIFAEGLIPGTTHTRPRGRPTSSCARTVATALRSRSAFPP
jgi:TPP-dependent pyruvate/acetoin dehydrogenase alpha subunit